MTIQLKGVLKMVFREDSRGEDAPKFRCSGNGIFFGGALRGVLIGKNFWDKGKIKLDKQIEMLQNHCRRVMKIKATHQGHYQVCKTREGYLDEVADNTALSEPEIFESAPVSILIGGKRFTAPGVLGHSYH
jgi:hypothetical protein